MRTFARPRVVASRCLGFAACRHDGAILPDRFLEKLGAFVDYVSVCPEEAIGLGTPRDPIRIVRDGSDRLLQPSTGKDLTAAMDEFSASFLATLEVPDGFVLKSRSPSCAVTDTKVWNSTDKKAQTVARGPGLFAKKVIDAHGDLPVIDEGRLKNFSIREQFYTSIFSLAEFREVAASGRMRELVDFHASQKLTLLAHNETEMRRLGAIVANSERLPFEECAERYAAGLRRAFAKPARYTAHVNVLQHALGYFSKTKLAPAETKHFLDVLDRFRAGRLPLSSPVGLLRSFIVRFGEPWLARQSYFEPYPDELVEITDSGKGRGK